MASTATDILDGVSSSLAVKAPVRVATTAAITLSGTQTIDGVAVVAGDRVLVKNQTDTEDNGIYVVKATAWVRSADFNGPRDVVQGTIVNVTSGALNAGYFFSVTTASPVIGTTAIEWVDVALNVNDQMADLVAEAEAAQAAAVAAQAAAEAAATSSDYLSTGLGATAGITVLGSLDATNTASGYTRYDNTTAGTFPSGVTKADGGIVATYRRTASSFVQTLYAITTTRTYERRYEGSFGPWEEVIKAALGAVTGNALIYNGSAWVAGVASSPWELVSSADPATGASALVVVTDVGYEYRIEGRELSKSDTSGQDVSWSGGSSFTIPFGVAASNYFFRMQFVRRSSLQKIYLVDISYGTTPSANAWNSSVTQVQQAYGEGSTTPGTPDVSGPGTMTLSFTNYDAGAVYVYRRLST